MGRWAGGGRTTCESCKSIDIRGWHRAGRLTQGQSFSCSWSCNGEPSGNISVCTDQDQVVLSYNCRTYGSDWKTVEQRIPILWTACRFGGRRPWFQCSVYSSGRYCGRRVAKIYLSAELFACRHCYRLAYESQHERPHYRALSQAQNLRVRLGGSGSLDEPFPLKPKGMHWKTYERLARRAIAAERTCDSMLMQFLARYEPKEPRRGRRK
jgi:hypothetical protein